jgi:arylsulfatase A
VSVVVRGSGTIVLALSVVGTAALLGRSITGDAHAQEPVGTRGPNVVFLMDDLGYGDLGSYGASDARTPSIDRLAREFARRR